METREHEFPERLIVEDEIPETHRTPKPERTRNQVIARHAAIVGAGILAVVLLFKFVINPWVYQYFLDNPLTESEKREIALLEKYDIASLETSTKSAGRGYGGLPASVTYYVVDGVMRDCTISGPTEDPVLTCVGWEPPLRGQGMDIPADGIDDTATPSPAGTTVPEVSVSETAIP